MMLIQAVTGQNFMTLQDNNIPNISNKKLSVQLSLYGLSFLITDSTNKESLFFFETEFEYTSSPEELLLHLQKAFLEQIELQSTFNEVSLIYTTNLYNIVPKKLFDETKASEYLKFNSKILANDFVAYDVIEEFDICTVYIPFININNYLFDRFGHFNYFHSTTILLKHLLSKEKHFSLPKVYINIYKNSFDFIAIKNGSLLICNTYEYKTSEDFIYYILFCLEQLKLNPDRVDIYLSGAITKEDPNYTILYNYIRNISFYTSKESDINIPNNKVSNHQQLILKLLNCE